jgi:hypothetical protein
LSSYQLKNGFVYVYILFYLDSFLGGRSSAVRPNVEEKEDFQNG